MRQLFIRAAHVDGGARVDVKAQVLPVVGLGVAAGGEVV
jgi:hypothetical protein